MAIRKCWVRVLLLLVSLSFPSVALANEICYSPASPSGSHAPPTNATLFLCPTVGSKTLPQLAALGLKVASMWQVSVGGSNIAEQLILKRGALIYRNGFDS